jgi:hypothetical protein
MAFMPQPPPMPAAPGVGRSAAEDLLKVYAEGPAMEPGQFSLEDIAKIFPEFQHRPFNGAGFSEVMLPFAYSDPKNLGNSSEALALDALISNDLDWSPGCYCARHAFFVFKRDFSRMQALRQNYDPALISSVAKFWHATHAIGGKLVRGEDGYTGTIEIYGVDGRLVHTQSFEKPQSFWELLGAMDVDAMTFLDAAPSPALADYLTQPRCRSAQSLIDLGRAAFMAQRSAEEFDVYSNILREDPGFAMVRHWYASESRWATGDEQSKEQEDGKALESRIEPGALSEFYGPNCTDQNIVGELPGWIDQAAGLAGEDCPWIIGCRISNGIFGAEGREQAMMRGLAAAAKYPNSHSLLIELGTRVADFSLAASLMTCSMRDHYFPAVDRSTEQLDLAQCAALVGRDDIAMEMLSELGTTQPQQNLYYMVDYLTDAGRFEDAADFYQVIDQKAHPQGYENVIPSAAFSAIVLGKRDLLEQILKEQGDVLAQEQLGDVFRAYRDLMDGKAVDADNFLGLHQRMSAALVWNILLVAACDAKLGISSHHRFLTEFSFQFPIDRLLWIAQDDYQRRDPSADAGAFYDYLSWLFGEDPWVKKAVGDFHARGGAEKQVDPAALEADLQEGLRDGPYQVELGSLDWNHVLTPWRVAACVHQQIRRDDLSEALRIATLYRDYEIEAHPRNTTIGCMILRKVEGVEGTSAK